MASPRYFGYTMPFASKNGILPLQADERLIKNDILILLQTITGERVMRPTFGTEIYRYTFEMSDPESIEKLRRNIENAILAYEPRIILDDVTVQEGVSANVLNIRIDGRFALNTRRTLSLELNITLPGD